MKADIKERWIDALLSGNFPQAQGVLREVRGDDPSDEDGFCCLGVLCELAVQDGMAITHGPTYDVDGVFLGYQYDSATDLPPTVVLRWAGLTTQSGEFEFKTPDDRPCFSTLADENDGGRSFAEIAELIKKYF